MNNDGQRIDLFSIKKDIHLHHIGRAVLLEVVVHRRVTARHTFELVKEVQHDFGQRHLISEHDLTAVVGHVHLHAPLLVGKCHDRTHVLLRHVQVHRHDGLADFVQSPLVGHLGRVLHHLYRAIHLHHLVDHAGRGGDQVLVELALKPLLHDLHVQQTQKAATKAETQRLADLRFVMQRRVIKFEFFEAIAQAFVLIGLGRIQARKHLGLNLLEARQGFGRCERCPARARFDQRDGVADLGGLQFTDTGNDVAHFTRFQ